MPLVARATCSRVLILLRTVGGFVQEVSQTSMLTLKRPLAPGPARVFHRHPRNWHRVGPAKATSQTWKHIHCSSDPFLVTSTTSSINFSCQRCRALDLLAYLLSEHCHAIETAVYILLVLCVDTRQLPFPRYRLGRRPLKPPPGRFDRLLKQPAPVSLRRATRKYGPI